MKNTLTFLGTGGSSGVPLVGCSCAVCTSNNPANKRFRPSALLQVDNKKFLIDAGPDFRMQALERGITKLDGVLFTHAHHDHTAGIDDLKPICFKRDTPLPILLSPQTANEIQMRFSYIFTPINPAENTLPRFHIQLLTEDSGEVIFENTKFHYMTYSQPGMSVNGYRFGNMAYLSDIRHYPPSIFTSLKGVEILIVGALRYTHSPFHFTIDEAIDFASQVDPSQVWFTHLSHELEHDQTNANLPSHIRLAYDGLEIEIG